MLVANIESVGEDVGEGPVDVFLVEVVLAEGAVVN